MRIVLTDGNWVVVELDKLFYFIPENTSRKAKYVGFNVNKELEYFKNKKIVMSRLTWKMTLECYPPHFYPVNIKQDDFPEKVIQILKILGILNDDITVNSKYFFEIGSNK